MPPSSLLQHNHYSTPWIKDFYTQTGIWWGADPGGEYYQSRKELVERLGGPPPLRVLELGAGSGGAAALAADAGYNVVAVDLCPVIRHGQALAQKPHRGSLLALEADFYTVELEGRFDVVCYWDGFGLGSDRDQRRILRRIAREWLAPGGCVLIDVFSPLVPARKAGTSEILPPMRGVPGSVEMDHRIHFDPLHCRWIDEWVPTAAPEKALAQTVRCYTPTDFLLLLERTGLELVRLEVEGQVFTPQAEQITLSGPLEDAWSYLVQLKASEA